jgi:hypothetical protein
MNNHDAVNHPKHYVSHPSGVECIQVTEHMGFNLGNAMKYIWRADLKHDAVEDLQKAVWYIQRELQKRGAETKVINPADLKAFGLKVARKVRHQCYTASARTICNIDVAAIVEGMGVTK